MEDKDREIDSKMKLAEEEARRAAEEGRLYPAPEVTMKQGDEHREPPKLGLEVSKTGMFPVGESKDLVDPEETEDP